MHGSIMHLQEHMERERCLSAPGKLVRSMMVNLPRTVLVRMIGELDIAETFTAIYDTRTV